MIKRIVIFSAAIAAAVILFACRQCFFGDSYSYFYVRIDNSKTEVLQSRKGIIDFNGGMDLLYTLTAYSEKGEKTEISFGTTRHLREGAFLKLSVLPIRGVVEWEEVREEELPEAVKDCFY